MKNTSTHLIEADLESQQWIERYAEIKNLSIQETLIRLLTAGHAALERQELEKQSPNNQDEPSPRVKIGIQASVECLAILRKIHLPDLTDQKQLAYEVKQLIENTINQMAPAKG